MLEGSNFLGVAFGMSFFIIVMSLGGRAAAKYSSYYDGLTHDHHKYFLVGFGFLLFLIILFQMFFSFVGVMWVYDSYDSTGGGYASCARPPERLSDPRLPHRHTHWVGPRRAAGRPRTATPLHSNGACCRLQNAAALSGCWCRSFVLRTG